MFFRYHTVLATINPGPEKTTLFLPLAEITFDLHGPLRAISPYTRLQTV